MLLLLQPMVPTVPTAHTPLVPYWQSGDAAAVDGCFRIEASELNYCTIYTRDSCDFIGLLSLTENIFAYSRGQRDDAVCT